MATASRSRPSPRTSQGTAVLPPYQPLANPLNQDALNALHSFTRSYPLTPLTKRQEVALSSLQNIAADINERYQARSSTHQRQVAKRAERGVAEDEAQAEAIEKLRQETKEITTTMEEAVRGVIDSKAHVEGTETALRELSTNLRESGGRLGPTQSTLGTSQFRGQKRRRGANNDVDEDDNSDLDSPEPQSQTQEGPTSFLRRKISASNAEYEKLSLRDKYAQNNDYIGFRKLIHDAQHPGDDAPPMPHASTWFPSSVSADGGAGMVEDVDEDLQVASEKRSIRCPITLRPMKEPITSTKCPHSFEKEAIYGMLAASQLDVSAGDGTQASGRTGGRKEKAIKCPECAVVLTAQNLKTDAALVRKIRRIQAKEQDEKDDDSEGESGFVKGTQRQHISSSPGPEAQSQRIKTELAKSQSRAVSMVPATQLEGGDEEDDSYEMIGETQLEGSDGEADVVSVGDEEEEEEDEEDDE